MMSKSSKYKYNNMFKKEKVNDFLLDNSSNDMYSFS